MWEAIALITIAISEVPCCSMRDIVEISVSGRTPEAKMATSSLGHNEDGNWGLTKRRPLPWSKSIINHKVILRNGKYRVGGILNPPCQGYGENYCWRMLQALWVIYVYICVYSGSRNNRANAQSVCELGEQEQILLTTWCVCNWVSCRKTYFLWR